MLHYRLILPTFRGIILIAFCLFFISISFGQPGSGSVWTPDGNGYYFVKNNEIVLYDLESQTESVWLSRKMFIPENSNKPLQIGGFQISGNLQKILVFTNTQRVWRYETRGDYWTLDLKTGQLKKLGRFLPEASLMFAKFSPEIIPVEYPKVGETPSACRVGSIETRTGKITWIDVPGDNRQHYIPRMGWAANSRELILQQLNRKQNQSVLMLADVKSGKVKSILEENDDAWISVRDKWDNGNGWHWIDNGRSFIWITEKDGWRHLFRISRDGTEETLITPGEFDIISPLTIDEVTGFVYYTASPDNATERYLFKSSLDGRGIPERLSPIIQGGTHSYEISSNGKYAHHSFSNYFTSPLKEWVSLPDHRALSEEENISLTYNPTPDSNSNVEFFRVTTEDGVEMDGWMAKPINFDPSYKYPVLFYVYTEPAGTTVTNRFGTGRTDLYDGDLAKDGYIYISVDNRGTPVPKGRAWRKSIYRKVGKINISDQAKACQKLLELHPFLDPDRIAVHGWSGGGTATLNLLFQYPDLYQTGIAVAAVTNQLSYDNIYQERYMGLPQENLRDFVEGSPLYYAKNLEGNLLYIHGTGDDNVHYQNAELLVNELIRHNKQFQFMPYPNRAHGIRSGEGTRQHLRTLFTNFLREKCPPGPRSRHMGTSNDR